MRAYVQAPKPLTSAEVLAATRRAVDLAVDESIRRGGLPDAESFVRALVVGELHRQGFGGVDVRLVRPNDLNPWAAFYFFVRAGALTNLTVRFDVDGVRDPLLAIRLGVEVPIRPEPNHPYVRHQEPGVLAACLEAHYYHLAADGPDLFARLENRTRDPYRFGFETFVTDGDDLAVDHAFLDTGAWGLDDAHRAAYGL